MVFYPPSRISRIHHSSLGSLLVAGLALLCGLEREARAQSLGPLPFQDREVSLEERVEDLLARLTDAEKLSLLHQYQPPIDRLGMGAFKTGTEALHGVAWLGEATVFPQAIGLASTWNTNLIKEVGSVVGSEVRGKHVLNPAFNGLNVWSPVVNLLRDPRWGRNEEAYSEDAFLTGEMATAYAGGMRGDHSFYLKTAPTLKHWIAYNTETNRDTYSAVVPPRILNEYYREAFRPAIAAGAATGLMAGYNLINGRPLHVDPDLDKIVRSWSDQTLMNVSDAFAPNNLTGSEDYFDTQAEANAALLKAGLDSFTVDNENSEPTLEALRSALAQGFLSMADVERSASHILSVRLRLGEFAPPGDNPYASIEAAVVNAPEHQQLARKTAQQAMVLLHNERDLLPLTAAELGQVAVIGPLADTLYEDWYSGTMPYKVTPLAGLTDRLGSEAVVSTEAVDRIALRDPATGRYVTASSDEAGASLALGAAVAGADQGFDVFDWGEGIVTLRAAANHRFLTWSWDGPSLVNSEVQPNGWFVQQQLSLLEQADGTYVLQYAGYDTREGWFPTDHFIVLGEDGKLLVGAASPEAATHFELETLRSGVDQAVAAASGAEVAIVVVGSMPAINGRENKDRDGLALAPAQRALVEAVSGANPNTVVVLETSYPMSIGWAHDQASSLLWTTHAGQETGNALADVLFGDANPAGRLTQTWYASEAQLPDPLSYDIAKAGWTYQYFEGKPLYPFGYGLSYSSFQYGKMRLRDRSLSEEDSIEVSVRVTNTCDTAGDEVVQLYARARDSRVKRPIKQLVAFDRVHIPAHQTVKVRFKVPVERLRIWDVTRDKWVVESGKYDLMVGASSEDIRRRKRVSVDGETIPPRDLSQLTQAENYDEAEQITLVDATKAAGTAVASSGGGWIRFEDVDLEKTNASWQLEVSRSAEAEGEVTVRLDALDGPVLGRVRVPSTGDRYAWATVDTQLESAQGRHDLYLQFGEGDVRLDHLQLGTAEKRSRQRHRGKCKSGRRRCSSKKRR